MKKYKIHILVVMLIIVAALGTLLVQANDKSEAGGNDIILNISEKAERSNITSLTFSVDVKNVSDQAQVSVDFNKELPENAIKKCTYQDKKLNIYIAGISELFEEEVSELNIGTVRVANDTEGAKNIKIALIPDSVEFINILMSDISYQADDVELKGRITEEPEVPAEVDKTKLDSQIKNYNQLGLVSSNYTEESWKNFEAARKEAEALLQNANASQAEVDAMLKKLEDAYNALVSISDSVEEAEAAVKNKLNELNKLLSSEYTDESWNNLYNYMQQAQLMLDNGATKEELEDILTKLNAAQQGLVKEEETTTPKPAQTGATDTASKTGDESNVMLWIILAVVALAGAGVVMFLTKKKEK